jgi:transcriptional regulator with XRE-family HTH domain
LRELRQALGITQKQLAEALKISQAAISKQESIAKKFRPHIV